MKITKNTGELAPGTVVALADGEVLEIISYIKATGRYKVRYMEFDGEEFIPVGEERTVATWELVGGEI